MLSDRQQSKRPHGLATKASHDEVVNLADLFLPTIHDHQSSLAISRVASDLDPGACHSKALPQGGIQLPGPAGHRADDQPLCEKLGGWRRPYQSCYFGHEPRTMATYSSMSALCLERSHATHTGLGAMSPMRAWVMPGRW